MRLKILFTWTIFILIELVVPLPLNSYQNGQDIFQFLNLFQKITHEIVNRGGHKCKYLDLIFDSESMSTKHFHEVIHPDPLNEVPLRMALIVNLKNLFPSQNESGVNLNLTSIIRLVFPSKFHRPCSLTLSTLKLMSSSFKPFDNDYESEDDQPVVPIPHNILPGSPHCTYNMYFVPTVDPVTSLIEFAKSKPVARLQHIIFVRPHVGRNKKFDGFKILKRHTEKYQYWDEGHIFKEHFIWKKYLNFEENPIRALVCAVCDSQLEDYKKTGMWSDYIMATIYQLIISMNATADFEPVFSLPRSGPDEDGHWDKFMSPLMDGSGSFSTLMKQSDFNKQFVYVTRPTYYDSVAFIIALPKKQKIKSILVLQRPFSVMLWLFVILSILSIFLILEIIIHLERGRQIKILLNQNSFSIQQLHKRLSTHIHYFSLFALLQPIVDQNGLVSIHFKRNINNSVAQFIIGLWFLTVIVLGCAYRSKLMVSIVLPKYVVTPTTFLELAMSDYGIGAMFYRDNIETNFAALKGIVSQEVLRRTVEFEYFGDLCYHLIFEGNNVCIGYRGAFNFIGLEHLMDIHGRKIYTTSTDSLFHLATSVGLSPYYPTFLEPLNEIATALESYGFMRIWGQWAESISRRKGKMNAQKLMSTKKYYSGKDNDEEDLPLGRHFAWILGQLIIMGDALAFVSFLIEIRRADANYIGMTKS